MSYIARTSPPFWRISSIGYRIHPLSCLSSPSHIAASLRSGDLDLLAGVSADYRSDVARVIELAERARDSWTTIHTSFYSPPIISDAMIVLSRLADIKATAWGGYPQAERQRLALCRDDTGSSPYTTSDGDDGASSAVVAALDVRGNFLFDPATHRDFLGAILGTGVERSVVGDILVHGDAGAQILVMPSMVEHLEGALTQVRTVPVKTRQIPLPSLRVPAPRVQEITSVEASLRLDAIGSAGFRISRSKMADLIKSADVKVNWRLATKSAVEIGPGDVITCAGKGRLEVKTVNATKKGKWSVEMVRYL